MWPRRASAREPDRCWRCDPTADAGPGDTADECRGVDVKRGTYLVLAVAALVFSSVGALIGYLMRRGSLTPRAS